MEEIIQTNDTPDTVAQFKAFQGLFDFLNKRFFDDKLPRVILNFSRESVSCFGFITHEKRWQSLEGNKVNLYEISLNPRNILNTQPIFFISTLLHEMVHLWQLEYGHPSRSGYHNQEWAAKMESVGLTPSTTAKPGGKRTGQSCSHYMTPGGVFEQVLKALPKELFIPWFSWEGSAWAHMFTELLEGADGYEAKEGVEKIREQAAASGETIKKAAENKNKVRYTCPTCGLKVWGKPGLFIKCGEDSETLEE